MNHTTLARRWVRMVRGMDCQRDLKGCNMFVRHGIIYSYGMHYPIACYYPQLGYLVNSFGYSVTTSKHVSLVCSAIRASQGDYIRVPEVDNSGTKHMANLIYLEGEYQAQLKKLARMQIIGRTEREIKFRLTQVMERHKSWNTYLKGFGLPAETLPVPRKDLAPALLRIRALRSGLTIGQYIRRLQTFPQLTQELNSQLNGGSCLLQGGTSP